MGRLLQTNSVERSIPSETSRTFIIDGMQVELFLDINYFKSGSVLLLASRPDYQSGVFVVVEVLLSSLIRSSNVIIIPTMNLITAIKCSLLSKQFDRITVVRIHVGLLGSPKHIRLSGMNFNYVWK